MGRPTSWVAQTCCEFPADDFRTNRKFSDVKERASCTESCLRVPFGEDSLAVEAWDGLPMRPSFLQPSLSSLASPRCASLCIAAWLACSFAFVNSNWQSRKRGQSTYRSPRALFHERPGFHTCGPGTRARSLTTEEGKTENGDRGTGKPLLRIAVRRSPLAFQLQPMLLPQLTHLWHVPLRTVMLPHTSQAGASAISPKAWLRTPAL